MKEPYRRLFLTDSRAIRRELAFVQGQLELFESRPDVYGEAMRVGFVAERLRKAAATADRAWRRYDRMTIEAKGGAS